MKLDKRSKIFLIVFFSIILIPVIIIGTINYTKEQELKNRIENSKTTRTLIFDNISTAISLEELFDLELSKEYTIKDDISAYNEEMKIITYTNVTFFGADCKKEYVFYDNELGICTFDIDTSHWMPKDIYEELVKSNGEPDNTDINKESYCLETYIWYGKNGTITYNKLNNSTIELHFELSE